MSTALKIPPLKLGAVGYQSVKNILDKGLERTELPPEPEELLFRGCPMILGQTLSRLNTLKLQGLAEVLKSCLTRVPLLTRKK
jgi:hypothetical protein